MAQPQKSKFQSNLDSAVVLMITVPVFIIVAFLFSPFWAYRFVVRGWVQSRSSRDHRYFLLVYDHDSRFEDRVRSHIEAIVSEHAYIVRHPLRSQTFFHRSIARLYSAKAPYVVSFVPGRQRRFFDLDEAFRKEAKGNPVKLENLKVKLLQEVEAIELQGVRKSRRT